MNGWRLCGVISLLLVGMSLSLWASHGWDIEGLRSVIRATARASLLLFSLAFTAGALARLSPSEATRWLRANRRYIGVSFAVSHVIHLAAIITFARVDQDLFWKLTNVANVVLGGVAYVFIAAMTATSFDRTAARAAAVAAAAPGGELVHLVKLRCRRGQTSAAGSPLLGNVRAGCARRGLAHRGDAGARTSRRGGAFLKVALHCANIP